MSAVLRIRNWEQYQGYEKRGPNWLKLHTALIDDPEWIMLPCASRAILPYLWIVAARSGTDGALPADVRLLSILSHIPEHEVREGLPGLIERRFLLCDGSVAGLATNLSQESREALAESATEASGEKRREEESRGEKSRETGRQSSARAHARDEEPPPTTVTPKEATLIVRDFMGSPPKAANPLVNYRALVDEGFRLIREIAPAADLDPTEVLQKASAWKGRSYTRLDAMPDDRLAHTVAALRRWARELRGEPEPVTPIDARASPGTARGKEREEQATAMIRGGLREERGVDQGNGEAGSLPAGSRLIAGNAAGARRQLP